MALNRFPKSYCSNEMVGNTNGVEGWSIFVEGDLRNISVKIFQSQSSCLGGEVGLKFAYF